MDIITTADFINRTLIMMESCIYRGQSDNWPLIPSIGRFDMEERFQTMIQLEQHILEKFKSEASLLIEKEPSSDIEWLILGQHYGLPTRLLDWTTNPLKALFFACIGNYENDGFVYELKPRFMLSSTEIQSYDLNSSGFNAFSPKINNQRLSLQEGCFTIYPLNQVLDKFKEVSKDNFKQEIHYINQIIIPAEQKKPILNELNMLGVNHKTVFSGLDGVCQKISFEIDFL